MKIHHYFFFFTALFLPSQLSIHFWPFWSSIFGIRVDYLSPAIYLTDIFLFLTFLFYTPYLFKNISISKSKLALFVALTLGVFINLYVSTLLQNSIVWWLKALELVFLCLYVHRNKIAVLKILPVTLFIGISFTFILSLLQFTNQKTIGGIFYWLGERAFTSQTPGIALANYFGESLLRPYAMFPHPNVLAGFVLVSCLLLLGTIEKKSIKVLVLVLSFILIALSSSQAVWVCGVSCFLVWALFKSRIKSILIILAISVCAFSLLLMTISNILPFSKSENLQTRQQLLINSGNIFELHPLGIGLGNFTISSNLITASRPYFFINNMFRFQPVHNIYVLVLIELGLLFFVLLVALGARSLQYSNTNIFVYMSLLTILLSGMADHYWITLQQTQLLGAIVLGMLQYSDFKQNEY